MPYHEWKGDASGASASAGAGGAGGAGAGWFLEERDSYAPDVPNEPYHPREWKDGLSTLPGPRPLGPEELIKQSKKGARLSIP